MMSMFFWGFYQSNFLLQFSQINDKTNNSQIYRFRKPCLLCVLLCNVRFPVLFWNHFFCLFPAFLHLLLFVLHTCVSSGINPLSIYLCVFPLVFVSPHVFLCSFFFVAYRSLTCRPFCWYFFFLFRDSFRLPLFLTLINLSGSSQLCCLCLILGPVPPKA